MNNRYAKALILLTRHLPFLYQCFLYFSRLSVTFAFVSIPFLSGGVLLGTKRRTVRTGGWCCSRTLRPATRSSKPGRCQSLCVRRGLRASTRRPADTPPKPHFYTHFYVRNDFIGYDRVITRQTQLSTISRVGFSFSLSISGAQSPTSHLSRASRPRRAGAVIAAATAVLARCVGQAGCARRPAPVTLFLLLALPRPREETDKTDYNVFCHLPSSGPHPPSLVPSSSSSLSRLKQEWPFVQRARQTNTYMHYDMLRACACSDRC